MLRLRAFFGLASLSLTLLFGTAALGQNANPQAVTFAPLSLSLAADPAVVTTCAGDATTSVVHLNAKGSATVGETVRYNWRTSGGRIEGNGPAVTWNVAGLAPGYYKAFLEITNGEHGEECQAFSTTTILVRCIPPVCPNVSIVCPDRVVVDEPITFSANMTGGSGNVSATYNWTVSAGRIISGQGTPRITVDTKGLAGQTVKATFSVNGYPEDCSALCLVQIPLPKKTCKKFDEFPDIQRNDEKARLDNFAVEMQNDPTATAYVIVYPGVRGSAGQAQKRTTRIVDYLVNTRRLDTQRIVTIIGPARRDLMVELWVCPQGATPPKPGN
jgi:hypothetical protein